MGCTNLGVTKVKFEDGVELEEWKMGLGLEDGVGVGVGRWGWGWKMELEGGLNLPLP